ncbi:DUF6527 family protein [Sphingobium sp. CCH11-B1]|jgi:hypothetical protein|uniref:DUF6527 family protein n=1 Tax=Sphingobium sp. CCH11-B1 TaxID=1768781 RepID=UPI00082A930F|nr:DUF6527 family protein [Sphingobium sp. CCH11-B1]
MSRKLINFEFVEFIPSERAQGTLYISIEYATVVHDCLCGCGHKVVTPLSPAGWKLTFDGETITLDPSVGNWSFPCQSHYIIKRNRIVWAGSMTREQIERGRQHDRALRDRHYGGRNDAAVEQSESQKPISPQPSVQPDKRPFWRRWLGL